eukprot:CAMPEP_0119415720 /NCGR_PEP_ID=MMETSP1335-20130426/10318_1 /TAXON_ID=259385 /ORGANISM="Chrysoculter rhomboideus, Strain RCC1486" /LENGTH=189 /DNA_ID=CAMNT_0007440759 /DNA_START=238 /DNA_END=807 /DNA_ORIENTATION=+
MTHGVYLEVGVLCPTTCSTGYFFDRELCWSGICLDGNIDSHLATIGSARTCTSYHGLLCAADGEETFWKVGGDGVGYSGMESSLTHHHKNLILSNEKEGKWTVSRQLIRCFTLPKLLSTSGHTHLDLLILDVEGAELGIFAALNAQSMERIKNIIAETDNEPGLTSILHKHGFQKVGKVGYDVVYTRRT